VPRPKSPDPKTDALRSVGALNPHPAAVKDEIFAGSDFFDRRDLVQVRYEMVRACAHRRPTHRRDSNALRRVPAHLLQAQCRVRARGHLWPFAQEARSQGWPQTTCRGRRGVAGGAHAGPRVDAASLVELVKRRFGVEITRGRSNARSKKNARERARSRCWPRAFSDRALRGTAKHSVRGDGCLQRPWAGLADALWCGGLDASMGELCCPTSNST